MRPILGKGNHFLRILIIGVLGVVLSFFFFSWGILTFQKQIFPYSLLEKLTKNVLDVQQVPTDQDIFWAKKVQKGGYVLHFRHAQREKWNDVTAFDAVELELGIQAENSSFSRATCLTSQGIEEAKLIGEVFKITKTSISKVIASPSCRARQTATLAFNEIDEISNSLLHRTAIPRVQWEDFDGILKRLILNSSPNSDSNIFLSGHVGTLSFDDGRVIDINEVGDLDARDETGFLVLEVNDGKIIARHKFRSIRYFANALIQLPTS